MELKIHNFPSRLNGDEKQWVSLAASVVEELQLPMQSLNIVFTDDETLQQMHAQYLKDPSKTDVITFDLSDDENMEGEIYISIDRAEDQARTYSVTTEEEVLRLIIHGLLHLKGYDDLQEEARQVMKAQEDRLVTRFREKLNA